MSMVVTGATGFIGRHLLKCLTESGKQVRALTRRPPPAELSLPGVHWVIGDLSDPASWERLLEPGATVFNLAYSAATVAPDAIQAVERMIESCAAARISRLVHCSTVSVYGRTKDAVVTELTQCYPWNAYGKVKFGVERALLAGVKGRFECSILRPSSVFGERSPALMSAIRNLLQEAPVLAYLRTCLFGHRRTHLVPVETVVAALLHVAHIPLEEPTEIFIVSDDDEPINNFHDVDRILRVELQIPDFIVPPLFLPRHVLEALLAAMGRPNTNTRVVYSPAKLKARGFVPPVTLEYALRRFIRDYRSSLSGGKRP